MPRKQTNPKQAEPIDPYNFDNNESATVEHPEVEMDELDASAESVVPNFHDITRDLKVQLIDYFERNNVPSKRIYLDYTDRKKYVYCHEVLWDAEKHAIITKGRSLGHLTHKDKVNLPAEVVELPGLEPIGKMKVERFREICNRLVVPRKVEEDAEGNAKPKKAKKPKKEKEVEPAHPVTCGNCGNKVGCDTSVECAA